MRPFLRATLLTLAITSLAIAHDIPNARVDRSIQATIGPGLLRIDYDVSLAELTLTQDLRRLIGDLPGADRRGWFEEYGRVTGPLNAKGFLVTIDGAEVELRSLGFDLVIEGHPRYTFHFEAEVPRNGTLGLNDTNYVASEGTSRLALRPTEGVRVQGDTLPTDVAQISIRPVVLLTSEEERRTRRLTVEYDFSSAPRSSLPPATPLPPFRQTRTVEGISQLLDGGAGRAWPALLLIAYVLGAAHSLQPGHGKSMMLAASLGPGSSPVRGALLGLATALVHMTSVASIAGILWATQTVRRDQIHLTLAHLAGFVIAAVGFWKLGRHLGGYGEHEPGEVRDSRISQGIIPLALAGGVVPCWDAVAMVLLADAIGRLAFGVALLAAFSLGMATILVAIGAGASRFRAVVEMSRSREIWDRRLGIAGGVILSLIGLSLLRVG